MLRKIMVLLAVMVCMYFGNAYAENNYPYEIVCPNPAGGRYRVDLGDIDQWDFWKCECVSYTAYRMDDELYTLTGVHSFN
jgi:hypothetical protein